MNNFMDVMIRTALDPQADQVEVGRRLADLIHTEYQAGLQNDPTVLRGIDTLNQHAKGKVSDEVLQVILAAFRLGYQAGGTVYPVAMDKASKRYIEELE